MDWEAFYSSFRKPDFIPGYEIQNRLGGGAFGEVFKARKHSIGKAYAIKFLKLDDDAQREAVERELEQVRHFAAIDHPNLVTIEDMGTVMGVPYLVMGYAGEETLARRLRAGELDPKEAVSYFVQVARGVLALHDRRLVHFDLKPGNVFLKGDVARVGDYGLSKLLSSGRLTLSFGRGTPHYMAPEILRSRADHRADIYSLGVILYECLALRVPFESATPGGIVVRDEGSLPEFPETFPGELRSAVDRCLRLDPAERYASVEELLRDLDQTPRPGDSIRVAPLPRTPVAPVLANGAATAGAGDGPPTPVDELRSTAAELARGAVEVARGMWDGLRSAGGGAGGTRVVEAPEAPTPRLAPPPPPPRTPPPIPRAVPPPVPAPSAPPSSSGSSSSASSSVASAAAGTIPVPPPAAGGVLGTIGTALAIGVEVMTTLVGVLARVVVRGFALARGSARGGGALWRRALRFVLVLALLALAGAAIVFLAVLLLQGPSFR